LRIRKLENKKNTVLLKSRITVSKIA